MSALIKPELLVMAWQDNVIEEQGHEPTSTYVETCYLPILGPTSTWLYRRLGSWICAEPEGFSVDTNDLSRSLGLGEVKGHNAPLVRSIGRLAQFKAVSWSGEVLAVRKALPALQPKMVEKLPASAQAFHRSVVRRAA